MYKSPAKTMHEHTVRNRQKEVFDIIKSIEEKLEEIKLTTTVYHLYWELPSSYEIGIFGKPKCAYTKMIKQHFENLGFSVQFGESRYATCKNLFIKWKEIK